MRMGVHVLLVAMNLVLIGKDASMVSFDHVSCIAMYITG